MGRPPLPDSDQGGSLEPARAEAEKRIAEQEQRVTRQMDKVSKLAAAGTSTAFAKLTLEMMERRLALLRLDSFQIESDQDESADAAARSTKEDRIGEPTTTEILAWCEHMIGRLASSTTQLQERVGYIDPIDDIEAHTRILQAIVSRLQQGAI